MSLLTSMKNYFLRRMDSVTAWIGAIFFVLEIALHRDASTLMLIAFLLLIFTPDGNISAIFKTWATNIRSANAELERKSGPRGGFTPPKN